VVYVTVCSTAKKCFLLQTGTITEDENVFRELFSAKQYPANPYNYRARAIRKSKIQGLFNDFQGHVSGNSKAKWLNRRCWKSVRSDVKVSK
jgi:hypothetical protein